MQYSGESRDHSISAIEGDGLIIVLEDSSRWSVYEGFASRASGWKAGNMIGVKAGGDDEYPYLLVNMHCNDSIECKLIKDCG